MKFEQVDQSLLANKIKEESTVVQNILSGKFIVEFISENLDKDEFKDSNHLANCYNYKLTIPSPNDDSKKWETTISIYHPTKNNVSFEKVPDFRIKILTGQGEMELTKDIKIREMIFKKIAEQINIQNDIKNEYIPQRHFSFDGFLEIIEYLEDHKEATEIPAHLWVARKKAIAVDNKLWILMKDTLENFKHTIYRDGGENEFQQLYNRVKQVNPDF